MTSESSTKSDVEAKRAVAWWKAQSDLQRFLFFYDLRKKPTSAEHGICLDQLERQLIVEKLYAPSLLMYVAKLWTINRTQGTVELKHPVRSESSFSHLLESTRNCLDPADMKDYANIDFPRGPLRALEEREHMLPAMLEVFDAMIAASAPAADVGDKADSKGGSKAGDGSSSNNSNSAGADKSSTSKKASAKLEKARDKFVAAMKKLKPAPQYFAAILTARHTFFENALPPMSSYRSWWSTCVDAEGGQIFIEPYHKHSEPPSAELILSKFVEAIAQGKMRKRPMFLALTDAEQAKGVAEAFTSAGVPVMTARFIFRRSHADMMRQANSTIFNAVSSAQPSQKLQFDLWSKPAPLNSVQGNTLVFMKHLYAVTARYWREQPHFWISQALTVTIPGYEAKTVSVNGFAGTDYNVTIHDSKSGMVNLAQQQMAGSTHDTVQFDTPDLLCIADNDLIDLYQLDIAEHKAYPNFQRWRNMRPLWERPSMATLRWFAMVLQAVPRVVEAKGDMNQFHMYDESAWWEHTVKVARWNPETDAVDKQASVTITFPDTQTRAGVLAHKLRASRPAPGSLVVTAEGPWKGWTFTRDQMPQFDELEVLKLFPDLKPDFAGLRDLFITVQRTLHTREAQAAVLCCALMWRKDYARLWKIATERLKQIDDAKASAKASGKGGKSSKADPSKTDSATSWAYSLALLAYMRMSGTEFDSKSAAASKSDAADSKTGAGESESSESESFEQAAHRVGKRALAVNNSALLYLRGAKDLPHFDPLGFAEGGAADLGNDPDRALRDNPLDAQGAMYVLIALVHWRRAKGSIEWLSALAGAGEAFKPTFHAIKKAEDKQRRCANPGCVNPGLKKCSRCQAVYYCAPDCQIAHWATHKPKCKKPAAAAAAPATAAESAPQSSAGSSSPAASAASDSTASAGSESAATS